MIKKIIKHLTLKITNLMKNHHEKKVVETPEEKKVVETPEEKIKLEQEEAAQDHAERKFENEIDHQQFAVDMMKAFISANDNLKIIKKQFQFDANHFVSMSIEENERLLKIIESMKPIEDGK